MLNLVQAGLREPGKSHKNFLKQADVCKRCNTERFERSHHCSMCSQCTLRMDHHCQWTDNCVGLKNHKNFLLYVLFTVLGGSLHVYFALCYILGEIPDVMPNMLLKLFFYFHTLIIIIFTYFCCTLLNLQLRLIYNNVTTIEYYKEIGMNFSFIKCVVFNIVRTT